MSLNWKKKVNFEKFIVIITYLSNVKTYSWQGTLKGKWKKKKNKLRWFGKWYWY